MKLPALALLLCLAGCATTAGTQLTEADLANADVAVRTEGNGDVVQEYRIAGQLRAIRVTPVHGPAYTVYDNDGDGRMDKSKDGMDVSPVYWKLFGW